jgi:group I intron endonuclease
MQAIKKDRRSDFQIALLEQGFSNFKWEQVDTAGSKEELNTKEKYWVAYYKANDPKYGYNMNDGGSNYKASLETRQKLSELKKGNKYGLGKHPSAETRQKLSKAKRGENASSSKLTETDVKHIKTALANGESCASIGRKYGVHGSAISQIKHGVTWKHIGDIQ